MELYLIRHGIAEEKHPDISDASRKLTKDGEQKTKKVAHRLQEMGLQFDVIASSPLVRAWQTAKILHNVGLSSQVEECSHLAPDGSIHDWVGDWLEPRNYSPSTQLAVVGHEPNLSNWAEFLVWGEVKGQLVLKKAGMIGVQLPETGSVFGRCQMFWLTPPKYLL
ncbi:phosphohistidine phosphatase SixA [Calothrix sp. 336/3]|uniref:phosphohistidine phosphatase SixA n=1 Tax=Calothrix sp. 336/3 TaxID=1337936 RepID=UPI0004E34B8E|nr:phosphohistidine phosphatase SixA [Calothrix sp. 336/3]AKG24709.1 hypothetical protein IJ00_17695 [Calothrix sp. 336/3]